MITLNNIAFDFAGNYLYKDASFDINPKERIGIVGRNGTGKSTLLRILNQEYQLSSGSISYQKNLKISFFNQDLLSFETNENIVSVVLEAFQDILDKIEEIEKIADLLEKKYEDELLIKMSQLQEEVEIAEGYQLENKVKRVLAGLGFKDFEFEKSYNEFSGGWRMRIMLAKCILQNPDILMLDEPTNHLDLPTIKWLEQYMMNFEGTMIVVSHDRFFLDRACNRILEIENLQMTAYQGNYSAYIKQKNERLELLEKAYKNQQAKLKQEERFIERFRYKDSKAKAVQSRIKLLEKKEKIVLPDAEQRSLNIRLKISQQPGKILCELKNIDKKFPNISILKDASGFIERGDKIALIGANGMGKSTLLRIVFGSEDFSGIRKEGHNVQMQFFAQHQLESLNAENTVLSEMLYDNSNHTETEVRKILGAFLFSGETVDKKIKVLSGGERSRVALAKIILSDSNFLLLDEPTNHLDMQAVEMLIESLRKYEGSYIAVSHNRYFLKKIANKIWYIENQKIKVYPGNYEEYENYRAEQDSSNLKKQNKPNKNLQKNENKLKNKPSNSNENYKERKAKNRKLNLLNRKLENLDLEIEQLKKDKLTIELELAKPEIYAEKNIFKELQNKLSKMDITLENKNNSWENLFEEISELEE